MMTNPTPEETVALIEEHGGLKPAARAIGMNYSTLHRRYCRAVEDGLMKPMVRGAKSKGSNERDQGTPKPPPPEPKYEGRIKAMATRNFDLPKAGKVRRYLFTVAQNETKIHEGFWENVLSLAEHYDAEIHVSRCTYVKSGLGASGDKARVLKREYTEGETGERMWWEPKLIPFFSDERVEVAPGLVWCGEMNTLPTASNPLSGMQVYTGRKSGIFPHNKIALESIASTKHEPAKFNMTTGTVTVRNYIQKKAGLKAEFHHCYGAVLVEVDSEGRWFCRHINGDSRGTIYDLDVRAKGGKVTTGHRVDSITWGDGHSIESDATAWALAFDEGGIKDTLRPKADFIGDMLTFKARSHHSIKDPHRMFRHHIEGTESVEGEYRQVGQDFKRIRRSWCRTHAVDGNHEQHPGQWLKREDGRKDPVNAVFWLKMQSAVYDHFVTDPEEPNYLQVGLNMVAPSSMEGIIFLRRDESVIRCPDAQGGIECGSHGDEGPRGSRGSPRSFARMGRKRNIGHHHACAIVDGTYVAGTLSVLDPDWTLGPSDWSHSHIVTYPNGKRTILVCWNGKWRADMDPVSAYSS